MKMMIALRFWSKILYMSIKKKYKTNTWKIKNISTQWNFNENKFFKIENTTM
jgi:hypothetical protein